MRSTLSLDLNALAVIYFDPPCKGIRWKPGIIYEYFRGFAVIEKPAVHHTAGSE
jgi:hypothetical protein